MNAVSKNHQLMENTRLPYLALDYSECGKPPRPFKRNSKINLKEMESHTQSLEEHLYK